MSEAEQCEKWAIALGTRNNLLYNDIPYIPMLVEDIQTFISFDDHEKNGVKSIQTLGELIPKTETRATLVSLTPGNDSEFPISLKNLDISDIYIKGSNDIYCAIWERHIVFKVYGTLETEESEYVLETTHLVPVYDVISSWNVMTLLVPIARTEYRYYYRTKGQNNMLQLQWDEMKKKGKRLVNEKIDVLY